MHCPNCGSENDASNRFCLNCGHQLQTAAQQTSRSAQPPPSRPDVRKPTDPRAEAVTIGAVSGILGGGLTALGWMLPWFSLGSLANTLLRLLELGGGGFGLDLGRGVGNGLQLSLFTLIASFAALSDGDTALLGLFGLLITGVIILVAVLAILNIRTGIKTFEQRTPGADSHRTPSIHSMMQTLRSRSTVIFVIMLVIFILISVIPFGTSVLSGGFYTTALGAIVSYFGAFYVQTRLRSFVE